MMKSFLFLAFFSFLGLFCFLEAKDVQFMAQKHYGMDEQKLAKFREAKQTWKNSAELLKRKREMDQKVQPTGKFIIRSKKGTSEKIGESFGLDFHKSVPHIQDTHIWSIPLHKRGEKDGILRALENHPNVLWVEEERFFNFTKFQTPQNDPLFSNQWHLQNTGQGNGVAGRDARVIGAWNSGYSGAGINIVIADDGLDFGHPDFSNYRSQYSYDFNDQDSNPSPSLQSDVHGTACAGVAAAAAEGTCGVGAAYEAGVSALRIIAGPISNSVLAQALVYQYQNNHIFSNSWGVDVCGVQNINGRQVVVCDLASQSRVLQDSFQTGVENGRGGKGTIYVFAAGNTKEVDSNVNYQDIPRSPFVISVGAYTNGGVTSSYSDPGAALLVSAPSNGGSLGITTSDVRAPNGYNSNGQCTSTFGGTSSACPLVAGVIALMLEANPNLTWRDVQDIIVKSSYQLDTSSSGWQTNRAGLHFHHDYGFGSIDAQDAVTMSAARTDYLKCMKVWKSNTKVHSGGLQIPDDNLNGVTSEIVIDDVPSDFRTIEQILVTVQIEHPYRGDLGIQLLSPSGGPSNTETISILAVPRNDPFPNYNSWTFKTNVHWGESARGTWKLVIFDAGTDDVGSLQSWEMTFIGTCTDNSAVSTSDGIPFTSEDSAAVFAVPSWVFAVLLCFGLLLI